MGEVFEAVRVGPGGFKKSVAIKQLPQENAIDGESVRRFLNEARISAQLEHANIVRVHDLLALDGYYLVMELLRGRSAGDAFAAVRDQVSWWIAAEIADQTLAGLVYAHALGLVHRDLSPRNLFLTTDGSVKILDFGIAKLRSALTPALTQHGQLQGTLAFIAPEQARAEESDPRSDLYQVGGLVYFALSRRAPHGEGNAAELLARAVNGRPTPLVELCPGLPEELYAWVERAMAHAPDERFESAEKMREALRPLLQSASSGGSSAIAAFLRELPPLKGPEPIEVTDAAAESTFVPRKIAPSSQRLLAAAILFFAIGIGLFAGVLIVHEPQREPEFQRVTFKRGTIYNARFTPDGGRFVYSAKWEDRPTDTFIGSETTPDARSLDLKGAEIVGMSQSGAMAMLVDAAPFLGFLRRGTLARVDLAGGAARELLDNVQWADWTPDGEMALLRWNGARTSLELPRGNVLYESEVECLQDPRISPDGSRIAFVLHPVRMDTKSSLAIIDRQKNVTFLVKDWNNIHGIAWRNDGLLFSGHPMNISRQVWAIEPGGKPRPLGHGAGNATIFDLAPDGRALIVNEIGAISISAFGEDGKQRDLSQFDMSYVADLSSDGSRLLLGDGGDALRTAYGVYWRPTDGSPAVHIGNGVATGISPDGRWATATSTTYEQLRIIPTGAGETREIDLTPKQIDGASWFPDGKRLLVSLRSEEGAELAIVDVLSSRIDRIEKRGLAFPRGSHPLSLDGRIAVLTQPADDSLVLFDLESGEIAPLPGALAGETPLRWSEDGKSIYVARYGTVPVLVHRIEVSTGARTRQAELMPSDPSGVFTIVRAVITPDGSTIAFNYLRLLSTLFVARYQ